MSPTLRAIKMIELLNLEQGDIMVLDYETKFITVLYFSESKMLIDEAKTRMFKDKLHSRYNFFYFTMLEYFESGGRFY